MSVSNDIWIVSIKASSQNIWLMVHLYICKYFWFLYNTMYHVPCFLLDTFSLKYFIHIFKNMNKNGLFFVRLININGYDLLDWILMSCIHQYEFHLHTELLATKAEFHFSHKNRIKLLWVYIFPWTIKSCVTEMIL